MKLYILSLSETKVLQYISIPLGFGSIPNPTKAIGLVFLINLIFHTDLSPSRSLTPVLFIQEINKSAVSFSNAVSDYKTWNETLTN